MNTEALAQLFSLKERVALVTGASGGIGRALAEGIAMAGAKVALNGRAMDRLQAVKQAILDNGGEAEIFAADLSELDAIQPLVDAVAQKYGPIDILVNCAGTNRRLPTFEVTPEIYDKIMATNLRSTYFLTKLVGQSMAERNGGKIINIGSITSSIGLMNVGVYGMTKSALAQLTKTMAIEFAQYNIQINCLCPGFIKTDLTAPLFADPQKNAWIIDRIPLKHPGTPADLVGLTIFMASHASDYMTGQSVYVDGGMLAGSQW